jgi:hypothetical protein
VLSLLRVVLVTDSFCHTSGGAGQAQLVHPEGESTTMGGVNEVRSNEFQRRWMDVVLVP